MRWRARTPARRRSWLRAFSTERPRRGRRRAAKMLRRSGRQVHNKYILRLWRNEVRPVPQRRRKRLVGIEVQVGAFAPIRPNVVWAMDVRFDTTADDRTLKMLNIIAEFTCEALAIEVDRSIDAERPHSAHGDLAPTEFARRCTQIIHPGPQSGLDHQTRTPHPDRVPPWRWHARAYQTARLRRRAWPSIARRHPLARTRSIVCARSTTASPSRSRACAPGITSISRSPSISWAHSVCQRLSGNTVHS